MTCSGDSAILGTTDTSPKLLIAQQLGFFLAQRQDLAHHGAVVELGESPAAWSLARVT